MAELPPLRLESDGGSAEPLALILDAMVDGVFVTDAQGRITRANRAFRAIAGQRVRGITVTEAIGSDVLAAAVERTARARAVEALEVELRSDEGRKRWLAVQLTPLPGPDQQVVAVLHDITQLKRTEQVRRDFVANASHELRTPLTAIAGFAETLQEGALDDPVTARRFLSSIRSNTGRLIRLVEDLLALSRAESPDHEFEIRAVDVVEACQRVVDELEARVAEKRLTLVLELDGEVVEALADPQALDQILLNLIDNAIKYTPEDGAIRVCAELSGSEARIHVTDTGPGIKPKYLDRIFQRFYRVDKGRSRDHGGTGLGLSIVRHLVGRMGGQVQVHSEVGSGSTFSVRLRRP